MTTPQPRSWPEELDALVVAPALHRGLLDNDRVRVLEVVIEPEAHEPEQTHQAPHRTAAPGPLDRSAPAPHFYERRPCRSQQTTNEACGLDGAIGSRRGHRVKKLPDRVWKLPRYENDEAAAEEGIGRILALWTVGNR